MEGRRLSTSSTSNGAVEEEIDFLHITALHGVDISSTDLEFAVAAITPKDPATLSKWQVHMRWEPLHAKIWNGRIEVYNAEFVDIQCIVATEVYVLPSFYLRREGLSLLTPTDCMYINISIEHLPEDVLEDFAPVLLGLYHPSVLLITTPSYTFNARFTPPDAAPGTRKGYLDPTGRTNRIFRHDDHKFEWTVAEFTQWCLAVAEEWGYEVEVGGVGRPQEEDPWGREAELGFASQTAVFRRMDGKQHALRRASKCVSLGLPEKMLMRTPHILIADHQHPLSTHKTHPAPLNEITAAVRRKMEDFRQGTVLLRELWFEPDISLLCGGWVEVLVAAIHHEEDLTLVETETKYDISWSVINRNFIPRPSSPPSPEHVENVHIEEDDWEDWEDDHEEDGRLPRAIGWSATPEDEQRPVWEWGEPEATTAEYVEWGS